MVELKTAQPNVHHDSANISEIMGYEERQVKNGLTLARRRVGKTSPYFSDEQIRKRYSLASIAGHNIRRGIEPSPQLHEDPKVNMLAKKVIEAGLIKGFLDWDTIEGLCVTSDNSQISIARKIILEAFLGVTRRARSGNIKTIRFQSKLASSINRIMPTEKDLLGKIVDHFSTNRV